jgi:hypothetical protein
MLLLLAVFAFTQATHAQVTIGSGVPPHDDALLDLKEFNDETATKGLLLPRVSLTAKNLPAPMTGHKYGMIVYNIASSPTDDTVLPENRVSPGFYYNTGNRWERLHSSEEANWFYMPSIAIDVTTSGTFERNLYLEYRKQFEDLADGNTPPDSPTAGTALVKSSPNAPNPLTKIFNADELYYYVTGYDAAVFSFTCPTCGITADGKLTYTVDADNVTGATYMNIVFVEK